MARDAHWAARIHCVAQDVTEQVADAANKYYRNAGMTTSIANDGQLATELALNVIRQTLPDVFATVGQSMRETTTVRAPDGLIQRVVTRTIDAAA